MDTKQFLYLCLVALLFCMFSKCNILRLSCKEYGLFNKTMENFVFHGSIIGKFWGISPDECERKCLLNNGCKSINVQGGTACELVSKTALDVPGSQTALVKKSNWTYKAIDDNVTLIGENCQVLTPCLLSEVCRDTCECTGYECSKVFKDCKSAYDAGFNRSGVYQISADGFPRSGSPVFCDMETDEGPWFVFQRRIDDSVSFRRNWSEYKHGFGEQNGNFWLGLDKLHLLAAPGKGAILRVDMRHRSDSNKVHAAYTTFEIGNDTEGYRLNIGGFSGDAGDSMGPAQNGKMFSTFDHDQDTAPNDNCADIYKGGFWFASCHAANLNGLYPLKTPSANPVYMSWWGIKSAHGNIMFSEMKVRFQQGK